MYRDMEPRDDSRAEGRAAWLDASVGHMASGEAALCCLLMYRESACLSQPSTQCRKEPDAGSLEASPRLHKIPASRNPPRQVLNVIYVTSCQTSGMRKYFTSNAPRGRPRLDDSTERLVENYSLPISVGKREEHYGQFLTPCSAAQLSSISCCTPSSRLGRPSTAWLPWG